MRDGIDVDADRGLTSVALEVVRCVHQYFIKDLVKARDIIDFSECHA